MTISVEDAVIAKITKGGERFEILVDPRKALEVRAGKDISLDELVVYHNSSHHCLEKK